MKQTEPAGLPLAGQVGYINSLLNRNCLKKVAAGFGVLVAAAAFVHLLCCCHMVPNLFLSVIPLHPIDLARPNEVEITDRNGILLRHIPAPDGTRSEPVKSSDIPLSVIDAFLAAEDKRFFDHCGYDLYAIARALYINLSAGRIVSGASTITQQLVRISHPRKRTVVNKIIELFCAIKTEHLLSKREIIRHYLNRVPMGNNIHGVSLACRQYFQKDLSVILPQEAAFLAAIPQSPGRMSSDRGQVLLFKRQQWILRRMMNLGFLSEIEYQKAVTANLQLDKPQWPFRAPHFTSMVLNLERDRLSTDRIRTTLDYNFQKLTEQIVTSRKGELEEKNCTQMAVVIIENDTCAVRTLVGSLGISNKSSHLSDGWNNGAMAYRSAGSALKPFAYATAIEHGIDGGTVLRDVRKTYQTPLSDYRPLNFSREEHGPVLMRKALGASLNLPAVDLLKRLGVGVFFDKLKALGFRPIVDKAEHYGLGLVIGNLEVRLLNLCAAYSALARGGIYLKPSLVSIASGNHNGLSRGDNFSGRGREKGNAVFSKQVSYIILDMLSDTSPRMMAFGRPWYLRYPGPVAIKTGTSTSFRDCWMVAATPQYTVACWAGNFNGAPTFSLTGAAACGPVIHDIFTNVLSTDVLRPFKRPPKIKEINICPVSGCFPSKGCPAVVSELFVEGEEPLNICRLHKEKKPGLVYLSPEYALWESRQQARGVLGRYRLNGNVSVPESVTSMLPDSESLASARLTTAVTSVISLGAEPLYRPSGAALPANIKITSPLSVERFIYDPFRADDEQVIRLQAQVLVPVESIQWYIDGVPYAVTGPPYETRWAVKRGLHRIVACCPDGTADAVTVTVE